MAFLEQYKTYIVGVIMIGMAVLKWTKVIDEVLANEILVILGAMGLTTLAAGKNRIENKLGEVDQAIKDIKSVECK